LAALRQGDSLEQRLAMPLLVLLAQQRKLIMLQSQVGRRCRWQGHALQLGSILPDPQLWARFFVSRRAVHPPEADCGAV
jgi:hypothetical protein